MASNLQTNCSVEDERKRKREKSLERYFLDYVHTTTCEVFWPEKIRNVKLFFVGQSRRNHHSPRDVGRCPAVSKPTKTATEPKGGKRRSCGELSWSWFAAGRLSN
jgi:hypothetical protein